MSFDWDQRDRINHEHAITPTPGDFWAERLVKGLFMVCAVTPQLVAYCEHRVPVNEAQWSFDLTKITVCTRDEFSKLVHYTSSDTKTWCDVRPGYLLDDVEESKAAVVAAFAAYKRSINPTTSDRLALRLKTAVKATRAATKARLLACAAAL